MTSPVSRRRFLAAAGGAALTAAAGLAVALRRTGSDGSVRDPAAARGSSSTTSTSSSTSTSTSTSTTTPTSTSSSTSAPTTTTPSPAGGVEVLCRNAWGAAPPTGRLPAHRIERLTVHHTAVTLTDNRAAPDRMRGHQRYHQRHGFTDIAYHLVIDGHGHVYEGRALDQPGETFTDYEPAGHLLVTLEGNFDEQALPGPQLEALADVMAWAATTFGIAPETITGHRDLSSTSCPGDAAYAVIADGTLAARVRDRVGARQRLVSVCGDEGRARVDAVEAGTI